MTQLVHLVEADDHGHHVLEDIPDVPLAGGQGSHTSARVGDLAGGAESQRPLGVARLLALVEQRGNLDLLIGQMVNHIGVVPDDLEVGGSGLHPGQTADRLGRVAVAVGVGVDGHAPHTLDALVLLDQGLHHIHVGAVLGHGDVDHLEAEILGDAEMAVIAGHRAEELERVVVPPGTGRIHKTLTPAQVDEVVHQLQRRVAAHDHFFHVGIQQLGKEPPGLRHALQHAVVAGVKTILANVIVHLEHFLGQIQLLGAGFAAVHVQVQAHIFVGLILNPQLLLLFDQFFRTHSKIICHFKHSFAYFLLPFSISIPPGTASNRLPARGVFCPGFSRGARSFPFCARLPYIIVHFGPVDKNFRSKKARLCAMNAQPG